MLFILYGATLDLGYESRCIFKNKGFGIIKKYNYVSPYALVNKSIYENTPSDPSYQKWYNDKIYTSKEVLEQMDFKYHLDGVSVGFNQKEIMDAVRGTTNCLLTIGASSVSLLIQLKKAFGDYITAINIFEDSETVLASVKKSEHMIDSEAATRISANERMQNLFIQNRQVFDEIVIYCGEKSIYNLHSLEIQFDYIIKKHEKIQKILNNKKYVEIPYSGKDPYLFISYAHADAEKVYQILSALQRNSCRLWYDDGIAGGENWRKIIASKLIDAEAVLLFSSTNSSTSRHVEAELNAALNCEKPIYTLRLDDAKFDLAYEMYLSVDQILSVESDDFENKLLNSLPSTIRSDF